MVEPVDPKRINPYRVQDVLDSDERRRGDQEDDQSGQEGKSFFSEKTDWRLLYEKTPHTTQTKTVPVKDIDHLIFENVSLKNNPSVLEARIVYRSRQSEGPVFVLVPRELAIKLQPHQRGSRIPVSDVTALTSLQVMIPEALTAPSQSASVARTPEVAASAAPDRKLGSGSWVARLRSELSLESLLLYSAGILLLICLILLAFAYF